MDDDDAPKPEHSLPSYSEPTPEEPRRISREEEAELALKNTSFGPGARALLIILFLATIASVPLVQFATEMAHRQPGASLPTFDIFKALPSRSRIRGVHNLTDARRLLPRGEDLKAAEKSLETQSVVSQWLLPRVQAVLTGTLAAGTEQVYVGREGWLFYRQDVAYVTGPPFLAPTRIRQRMHELKAVHPDPVKAIVDFRDQLAARGIDLVVMPVPVKPSIDGEKLSGAAQPPVAMQNASFAQWQAQLAANRVRVFDPAPVLMQQKAASRAPLYLRCDTHWRPETMRLAAERLAAFLQLPPAANAAPVQMMEQQINGIGDIARMLKLPEAQDVYKAETVTVQQVTTGTGLWRATPEADVLLLGDSFANIFSLQALGWGEAGGLAEHLSAALGGRPLDCILRNSDGSFATREILSHELARGRDRLAGKKLVIWEFAARELAFGDWKPIELKLGTPQPASFFVPKAGETVEVTGVVEAVSAVPRPGTVPYADHIVAVHLTDIASPDNPRGEPRQALVYLTSMRDNTWTPAARLRVGDRLTLRLRAWSDVAAQYDKINRSEIDDPALQLEEPAWGELVE